MRQRGIIFASYRAQLASLAIALLLFAGNPTRASAANGTWIDTTTGGLWSNPVNWSGGTIADGQDAIADFSTLDITADDTVHLDSPRTIGTLVFGDTTPSNNWTLDNNVNLSNILTLAVASGTPTIRVNDRTATINAALAGGQGLIVAGPGTLILGNTNTLSGVTTISSGALRLLGLSALQNSTVSVNVDNGLVPVASTGPFVLGGLSGSHNFAIPGTGSIASVTLEVGNDNESTAYAGVMSDNFFLGSLTKIGTGTLTLNGANTYRGATTINSGALQLGNASALQNSTVVVNVNGGLTFAPGIGAFTVAGLSGSNNFSLVDTLGNPVNLQVGNATSTYSGVIGGTGSLALVGTGKLTLSGANAFTGQTILAGTDGLHPGTLQLGNANALQYSTLVANQVGGGGLLFGPSIGTFTIGGLSGSSSFSLFDTAGVPVTLQIGDNNASTLYSGGMGDAATFKGSVVKVGNGTFTLAGPCEYNGPTTINAGVLQLGHPVALRYSTVVVNADGGLAFSASIGEFNVAGLAGSKGFSLTDTSGGPVTLVVGQLSSLSTTYSGSMTGSGSLVKEGAGALSLTGTNTFSGETDVFAGTLIIGNANALQNSTLGRLSTNGFSFGPAIGTFTIGGLSLTANCSLTDMGGGAITLQVGNNSTDTTYSGIMSGAGSLTKIGADTLTLSGANTFSGGMTINTGELTLAGANTSAGPTTVNGGTLLLGNGKAVQNSTVAVNVGGALAFSSSIGKFTVGELSGANNIALVDTIGNPVTLSVGNNNASATYAGVMSGTGALTKIGTGALTLSGANTFNGSATITAGVLQLGNANAAQNATIAIDANGGLRFSPSIATFTIGGLGFDSTSGGFSLADTSGAPITLQVGNNNASTFYFGGMTGAGSLTKIGTGTLELGAIETYTGLTTINGGSLGDINAVNSTVVVNVDGGLSFFAGTGTYKIGGLSGSGSFSITSGFTLQVGNNSTSTDFAGAMSGVGALTKIGTGTLTLSGASTLTGITTITAGILQLGNNAALQNSMVAVNANNGLTFVPAIGTFTIGGLSGSKSFALTDTNGAPITLQVGTNVGGNSGNATYSGVISGSGGLIYDAGSPTVLTLSGTSTYLGPTVVESGVVQVTGSLANNGSEKISVAAGADFTTASISRRVQPGGSYAGLGSTAIAGALGVLGSSADIRLGMDSNSSANDAVMQWRARNASDAPRLVSDVLNLTGMSSTAGSHVQTDPFVLQMTYNTTALNGNESILAAAGLIDLAWLNTSLNQPNGLWVNATAGDFGSGLPGDVFQNVQSSWDAFASSNGVTAANLGNFLGSYGVDVAHHQVWAVVNHNSQFVVVPEPSSSSLALAIAAGLAGLIACRRICRRWAWHGRFSAAP